jgi:hypothetical protein
MRSEFMGNSFPGPSETARLAGSNAMRDLAAGCTATVSGDSDPMEEGPDLRLGFRALDLTGRRRTGQGADYASA